MPSLSSVGEVFALLERGGGEAYFGEPVTLLEHSLQAAWFARRDGADDALVAAALLHDLGHLSHGEGERAADHGLDTRHEELAVGLLAGHVPASILDPIRMHVAAKRYLCFAEPGYHQALSPASQQSLALQGGVMTADEAAHFLAHPHAVRAVQLRRSDDSAKQPALAVAPLQSYRELVASFWS
jgi:phosphonate degradation associated HDIG domain protein